MAFATFLVWRFRTGACGVGAYGFWRYRMPPHESIRCSEKYTNDIKTPDAKNTETTK